MGIDIANFLENVVCHNIHLIFVRNLDCHQSSKLIFNCVCLFLSVMFIIYCFVEGRIFKLFNLLFDFCCCSYEDHSEETPQSPSEAKKEKWFTLLSWQILDQNIFTKSKNFSLTYYYVCIQTLFFRQRELFILLMHCWLGEYCLFIQHKF